MKRFFNKIYMKQEYQRKTGYSSCVYCSIRMTMLICSRCYLPGHRSFVFDKHKLGTDKEALNTPAISLHTYIHYNTDY